MPLSFAPMPRGAFTGFQMIFLFSLSLLPEAESECRLCRKKLQGKIRKKKNHQKEKDITGSVKRANHNKGSMIVSDPTELVQPGGNNHSSRFVRLCVGACFIHGAG